jgi:predicted nucleotidyltransferase
MRNWIDYFLPTRAGEQYIRKPQISMTKIMTESSSIRKPDDSLEQMIVNTIVKRAKPKRVILFGSRARADAQARSDYDVAIDDQDLTPAILAQIRAEMECLPTLLNIDLVWMNRAAPSLRQRIIDEGKTLYGQ